MTFLRSIMFLVLILSHLVGGWDLQAQNHKVLDEVYSINGKKKETVYNSLRRISDQTGYLFIYDSQVVDNQKFVKLKKGRYSLRSIIYEIVGNKDLDLKVVGKHILISSPQKAKAIEDGLNSEIRGGNNNRIIEGYLSDLYSKDLIIYCSISINNSSIGTVSNQQGYFSLIIPDSLKNSVIKFSHLGYQSLEFGVSDLEGRMASISLEPQSIPIQEVIVRLVDPIDVLHKVLEYRSLNYPQNPTYLTTFFREGVRYKNREVSLTEGVFKLYKSKYQGNNRSDYFKMLKMRRFVDLEKSDSLVTKLKSTVQSCLQLDLLKNIPEFISIEDTSQYVYTYSDITVIDDRLVNVISFEQREDNTDPLYKGALYVDAENYAVVQATFEINPRYIKKATNTVILKQTKGLNITPRKIEYTVSYKPNNDIYYLNHIRADLYFDVKKNRRLFSKAPLHAWFELVNCQIDTINVHVFPNKDRFPTRTILSETNFIYDKYFWGNFNTIEPENKLKELILSHPNKKIEEILIDEE